MLPKLITLGYTLICQTEMFIEDPRGRVGTNLYIPVYYYYLLIICHIDKINFAMFIDN